MHTCVESVFPLAAVEIMQNGEAESADAGREPVARETGAEGSTETPQVAERLPERGTQRAPWSAWAWLGLHRAREGKGLRPEGLSYRVLNDKIPKTSSAPIPSIVHVRVDALFASVEQVLNPKLRGKPVLVGRGAVASANYEAKMRGVKTGMMLREALRICPRAVVLPGQYGHYADFAEQVRRVLETYTPAVEAAARDDFYANLTESGQIGMDLRGTLLRMQMEVFKKTGLRVSIGAARTKVAASVASRLERPSGIRIVPVGEEKEFLGRLQVENLPGIGRADANMLRERGVTTIGELRLVPKPALEATFGEAMARQIWENSRGLDGRESGLRAMTKPFSRETSIEGGTMDAGFLGQLIEYLSERVGWALRDSGQRALTIGLRIRYVDGFALNQTVRLATPSDDERELRTSAKKLFDDFFTWRAAVELVGVSAANLELTRWRGEALDWDANRPWSLNRSVASVRRFGREAVCSAKVLHLRVHGVRKPNRLVMPTPCLSR